MVSLTDHEPDPFSYALVKSGIGQVGRVVSVSVGFPAFQARQLGCSSGTYGRCILFHRRLIAR